MYKSDRSGGIEDLPSGPEFRLFPGTIPAMKIMLAILLLLAQEADDPIYKRWSGCKPGSWVKFRRETVTAEGKIVDLQQEITQTLVEADAQKVVVESVMAGGSKAGKPTRDTYRVKTPL